MVDYSYVDAALFKSGWELTELEQHLAVQKMSLELADYEAEILELAELKGKTAKLWRWLEQFSGPPTDTYQETYRHWVQKIAAKTAAVAEARSMRRKLERSFHYLMMKVSGGQEGFGDWDFAELPRAAATYIASLKGSERRVTADAHTLSDRRTLKEQTIDRHLVRLANGHAGRSLPVDADSHFGLSHTEISGSLNTKLRILGEGIAMASVGLSNGELDKEFTRLTTDLLRRCLRLREQLREGGQLLTAAQVEDLNRQLELMDGIHFQAEKALSALIVSKNKPLHVKVVKS